MTDLSYASLFLDTYGVYVPVPLNSIARLTPSATIRTDNPNIFFTSPTNQTSFTRAVSISPVAVTIAILNPNSSASRVGLPSFAEEQIWSKTFSTPLAKAGPPAVRGGGGASGAGPSVEAATVRIAFCPSTVVLSLPTKFSAVSTLRFTDLRLWASSKVGKESIVLSISCFVMRAGVVALAVSGKGVTTLAVLGRDFLGVIVGGGCLW
ncbi:hypothetical protein ScalyP_jg6980 [Parmales sp. scaly parma]|nr:hypothetical protein ScalyP_jg6980 [Parmales sp. scaly parma]